MPDSMRDIINTLATHTPFMAVVGGRAQMNTGRVVESLIIAAVVALASRYVIVAEMKVEMKYVQKEVSEMKKDFSFEIDRVMVEIIRIKDDVYVPAFKPAKK